MVSVWQRRGAYGAYKQTKMRRHLVSVVTTFPIHRTNTTMASWAESLSTLDFCASFAMLNSKQGASKSKPIFDRNRGGGYIGWGCVGGDRDGGDAEKQKVNGCKKKNESQTGSKEPKGFDFMGHVKPPRAAKCWHLTPALSIPFSAAPRRLCQTRG